MTLQRFVATATLAACAAPAARGLSRSRAVGTAPAQITITNARSAPLTTFEIATSGEQPRLVAKLARPLAPGKSVALKLNKPAGCTYFVLARFGDDVESDSEGMDLCRDRAIRLTE